VGDRVQRGPLARLDLRGAAPVRVRASGAVPAGNEPELLAHQLHGAHPGACPALVQLRAPGGARYPRQGPVSRRSRPTSTRSGARRSGRTGRRPSTTSPRPRRGWAAAPSCRGPPTRG
jgi:hypothetical protein